MINRAMKFKTTKFNSGSLFQILTKLPTTKITRCMVHTHTHTHTHTEVHTQLAKHTQTIGSQNTIELNNWDHCQLIPISEQTNSVAFD